MQAQTSLLVKLCVVPTLVFFVGIAVSFNLFGYPADGFRARAATVLRETGWPHETYFPAHMFGSELVSVSWFLYLFVLLPVLFWATV